MYLVKRAIDGQVGDLKRLLGLHKGVVHECDDDKLTPLHYAAWYNRAEPVDMLLSFGAGMYIASLLVHSFPIAHLCIHLFILSVCTLVYWQ